MDRQLTIGMVCWLNDWYKLACMHLAGLTILLACLLAFLERSVITVS
jgi:hypothetical protein